MKFRPSNMGYTSLQHLLYLCDHIREEEKDQYVMTYKKPFNAKEFANHCWTVPGPKFTVFREADIPCAAGGVAYLGSGTFGLWIASTPQSWEFQAKSVTKAAKWLVDAAFEQGARKVITYELESRAAAMDWLERSLGMKRESSANGLALYARGN